MCGSERRSDRERDRKRERERERERARGDLVCIFHSEMQLVERSLLWKCFSSNNSNKASTTFSNFSERKDHSHSEIRFFSWPGADPINFAATSTFTLFHIGPLPANTDTAIRLKPSYWSFAYFLRLAVESNAKILLVNSLDTSSVQGSLGV